MCNRSVNLYSRSINIKCVNDYYSEISIQIFRESYSFSLLEKNKYVFYYGNYNFKYDVFSY